MAEILSGRKDAGKMGTVYVKYEDVEKFLGYENMIKILRGMKEKFHDDYDALKGKKIRIGFIQDKLYSDYGEWFEQNQKVPKNYDYLTVIREALDNDDLFDDMLIAFRGKSLCISYTYVRNRLIADDLRKGKYIQMIVEEYNVSATNVRKIKERYSCVTYSAEYPIP